MIRTVAVAAVATMMLTGCSTPVEHNRELADRIGCTNYRADDAPALLTQESGTCSRSGQVTRLYRFATRELARPFIASSHRLVWAPGDLYWWDGRTIVLQSAPTQEGSGA